MRTEAAGLPHRAVSTASTQLGKLRMPDAISLSPARQLNRWECPIECQWVSDSISRVPSEFPDLLIPPASPAPLFH